MHALEEEGVTGVICNIISFITGASGVGGFKGIQGNFSRDNLVSYNIPMSGEVKLTRLDTNESVTLSYDPSSIPPDTMMKPLMGKSLQGLASEDEKRIFRELWQKRVEEVLCNSASYPQLITITKE